MESICHTRGGIDESHVVLIQVLTFVLIISQQHLFVVITNLRMNLVQGHNQMKAISIMSLNVTDGGHPLHRLNANSLWGYYTEQAIRHHVTCP